MADPKLPVQVIVDAPVERTCLGRIHLHTAPNPTPEPTADEIRRWTKNHWPPGVTWVEIVLKGRAALLAERQIPPVEVPAVYLPDDGHWPTGSTVTVLLHAPPTDTGERARWRPYSNRQDQP